MTTKTEIINTVRDIEAYKHDAIVGMAIAVAALLGILIFRLSAKAIFPCVFGLLGAWTARRSWKRKKTLEKKLEEM